MLNRVFFSLTVSKFLITTGYGDVTKSEIIDFSEVGKYQCSNWIDYPIDVEHTTGGLLGTNIVVCGGDYPIGTTANDASIATDECYKITSKQTVKFGQMNTQRYSAASVTINSNTLWVTGGWDGNNRFSSTEFVYLNGAIQAGNSGCKLLKITHPKLDDPSVFKYTACSHTSNALNFLYALYPKLLRL